MKPRVPSHMAPHGQALVIGATRLQLSQMQAQMHSPELPQNGGMSCGAVCYAKTVHGLISQLLVATDKCNGVRF